MAKQKELRAGTWIWMPRGMRGPVVEINWRVKFVLAARSFSGRYVVLGLTKKNRPFFAIKRFPRWAAP